MSCTCRSPSGHINEYSSIYESNGPGPGPDGHRSAPGPSNISNRPFQSSDRSATRGQSTGRSIGASASSNNGPCSSYQAEEGRNGTIQRDKSFPRVALAPSHLVQNGNGNGNGQTSNGLGYECKLEHDYEHEHGHEKFSSPLLGYFSLPPQDLEGTASASSRCTGNSSALPSSPFDREYGVGAGGEGREERGRGPGRGREGGTGTGRGKARERSIDSVVSFTSESSYVTVIENSRKPKRPQTIRSDAESSLGLNTYQSQLSLSFGSKIGRLVYDSERKWGSWLGL